MTKRHKYIHPINGCTRRYIAVGRTTIGLCFVSVLALVRRRRNSWFCTIPDGDGLSSTIPPCIHAATRNFNTRDSFFNSRRTIASDSYYSSNLWTTPISIMKFTAAVSALFFASAAAFAPPAFVHNKNAVKSSSAMQMA